jgi:hypothetical protein
MDQGDAAFARLSLVKVFPLRFFVSFVVNGFGVSG